MEKRKINEIKQNPNNPKTIDWFKLEQLKKSIKEFPEMLDIRPIVVNPEGVIIGGNMRWLAAKELGFGEVSVLVISDSGREEEFMIKDNVSFGEWNWEGLKTDFKSNELLDWGLDVPLFFRDEEIEMGVQDDSDDEEEEKSEKKPSLPQSTKKALYLFFTVEQREKFVEALRKEKGEMSYEEVILEKIRSFIDGGSN